MKFSQLTNLLNETGLSPEGVAKRLDVSNATYRRWLKRPGVEEVPKEYERNIAGGIYLLLSEGKLSHESKNVAAFLSTHVPEFFQAAISRFRLGDATAESAPQQEQVHHALSHIGMPAAVQKEVSDSLPAISAFSDFGADWKERVSTLLKVIKSRQLTTMDKWLAFGALFYLITLVDLIPDMIPVFGYVDDFGILSLAAAYYLKKFPLTL
jgi:hypothetical protein